MAEHETAPRLRIHTLDGSFVELANVDAAGVMGLVDDLKDPEGGDILSFDLDEGRSQVHVPRAAIARVDVDWQVGWIARTRAWIRRTVDGWR